MQESKEKQPVQLSVLIYILYQAGQRQRQEVIVEVMVEHLKKLKRNNVLRKDGKDS